MSNGAKISLAFIGFLLAQTGFAQGVRVSQCLPPQYPPIVKASARLQAPAAPLSPVPLVFSAQHLPFFCKIEHQMAKKSALPLKFRLGDVPYVDYLEGKSRTR